MDSQKINMKVILTIVLAFLSLAGYAQSKPACTRGQQQTAEMQFEKDLKNGTLKIYTVGGLKPSNYKVDTAFQETYKLEYHDFGCIAPPNMDYYIAYNLQVFQHLRKKWGNSWEKDIKDNAMGFYKWKEAK